MDVGAGTGLFLGSIHDKFPDYEYHAIEPSRAKTQLRNLDFIKHIHEDFLGHTSLDVGVFDYITAWFVLEHVDNPLEFMKKIKSLLSSDGRAFLSVPNLLDDRSDIITLDHISKFTPKSFRNLCRVAGFEVVAEKLSSVSMYLSLKPTASSSYEIDRFDPAPIVQANQAYVNRIGEHVNVLLSKKDIAVFGYGKLLPMILHAGLSISCIIDDNSLYKGLNYQSIPVSSFDEFRNGPVLDILVNVNELSYLRILPRLDGYTVYS